ncbi:acyl-CoA dehydrogenase family protein [Pontibacter sp. G13]|uniref:acyl-CoA dehydrogenase family protein n=1 Tax=Pontibacter sp. G13 TaxID=3074898 RepID=UPI002889C652|nr:acyl-CoA dehydrogenase family protein [Pontibacter sp. G13]WNJ21095.1 acyl-CoA dehydrogenase family protein [Pontibacter sp. G13]
MPQSSHLQSVQGGTFLFRHLSPSEIYVPEQFNEEQLSILDMCREFVAAHIFPNLERMDALEPGFMESLLDQAAELGLLGAGIDEQYGGLGMDFPTQMLIQQGLGQAHAFATAFAAHTGIGTYPVQYFGTPEQKAKFLPGIADGTAKPCYNLTEPNAGSDALSGKTRADLSDDGSHYILNGQKCWITNSGFADLFMVFAQVEGNQFSCFVVPADTPGLTLGDEEKKLGIKGSSTRQVFYADAKVPVENLIGQVGKGHLIAFAALNIGRIKMAAACISGAQRALELSAEYAKQRVQFKQPIAKFGAIQQKLADMTTRIFVLESAVYRATQDIDDQEQQLLSQGLSHNEALLGAADAYAMECAMTKVFGSEVLDFCVDQGVQIHGGNGYSAEYPIERCYRDSRIVRIYEGTSEINRILTVNTLAKRIAQGKIAPQFLEPAPWSMAILDAEYQAIIQMKRATLQVLMVAMETFGAGLRNQQQICLALADCLIGIYHAESMILRIAKAEQSGSPIPMGIEMAQVWVRETAGQVYLKGQEASASLADEGTYRAMMEHFRPLLEISPKPIASLKRAIAEHQLATGA